MITAIQGAAWFVAFSWLAKTIPAAFGLRTLPDLLQPAHNRTPENNPTLTVIVPARNEEQSIDACLLSLLGQDYPHMAIIAVDDRSTDTTGVILDELALLHPDRLTVLHVADLPRGWLGKTHAMALAAAAASTEFLLFTDADVLFRNDALRRSLAYAVATEADHLVTAPTPIQARWDESMMLGFFQIFGLWGIRPWRVANPRAVRDAVGIGAFNLLRRTAYEHIGGFAALRMEIVEDVGLGRRIKRAGLRQRLVFGRDLVRVHWAPGALGLVNVLTKNVFAALHFNSLLALAACLWLLLFGAAPFVALAVPGLRLPAAVTVAAIVWSYTLTSRHSGISALNALLAPVAAVLFTYALLRSTVTTLRQGGVVWRGTFYPLTELRARAAPLLWWRTEKI